MIFNIQSIRIQRPLSQYFEFLFLDAPFECQAGPGVLPFFDGCEPFRAWVNQHGQSLRPESQKAIEDAISGRETDVVGVMGFSQGARLGAGLLLMQQLRQKVTGVETGFQFGIFCMGISQPLVLEEFWAQKDELISIPSLHVTGIQDPWYSEGKKLHSSHFDRENSTLIELDVGHRLPAETDQNMRVVEGIKALYEASTGRALVDFEVE